MNSDDLTEQSMTEYTSATGKFVLKHPSLWVADETFDDASLVLADTQDALDRYHSGEAVETGDLIMNVGFLPFDLMRQRELIPLGIQFDASPDALLQSMLPIFRLQEAVSTGTVQLVSLENDREAGAVLVTTAGHEGQMMVVKAGEQVVALISTVTAPDEQEIFDEVVNEIVSSVVYQGESGELYNRLLTG